MAMGMSRDEYWHGDVFAALDYIEADRLRQERFNREAHLQGSYFCDALAVVIGNRFGKQHNKYPEEPYPFKEKGDNEDAPDAEALLANAWMEALVAKGQNWGKPNG